MGRPVAARTMIVALALAALAAASSSCSRAVRMSLAEPEALTQVAGSAKTPRFTRVDSVRTQEDGLLVVAHDSIQVYSRLESGRGLERDTALAVYERKRTAARLRVMGYQPAAGPWRSWEGFVRARGDSLEFMRAMSQVAPLRLATPADTFRLAARDLKRVDLEKVDPVRTTATIALVAVIIAGVAIAAFMTANFGAAPSFGPIGF